MVKIDFKKRFLFYKQKSEGVLAFAKSDNGSEQSYLPKVFEQDQTFKVKQRHNKVAVKKYIENTNRIPSKVNLNSSEDVLDLQDEEKTHRN